MKSQVVLVQDKKAWITKTTQGPSQVIADYYTVVFKTWILKHKNYQLQNNIMVIS